MEADFDKEIHALLRQTARTSEAASADFKLQIPNSESSHLDADEISAFAENALPEKTKLLYTEHFADCARCRTILANVISLNADAPAEIARTEEIKLVAVSPPWYRRLFAVPNLAYALGALTLVFAGLFAFTFLKNSAPSGEISQTREVPVNMSGASSDGETRQIETVAPSNSAAMSNAATAQSNAMTTANSAAATTTTNSSRDGFSSNAAAVSNSNASSVAANKSFDASGRTTKDKTQNEVAAAAKSPTPDENSARGSSFSQPKNDISDDEKIRVRQNNSNNGIATSSDSAAKPAAPVTATAPPPAKSSDIKTRSAAPAVLSKKNARANNSESSETKIVGGRNFRRDGNVWYDTAYSGQSTTNVARGSNEFKKLNSAVRSIAENLSGTIIVVFGGKAYRIQ